MNDVSTILNEIAEGDSQRASQLLPLVYAELRNLAAHNIAGEAPNQSLNPTGLVHEAYLRLVGAADSPRWESRGHFMRAAAEAMRRILIDRARRRHAQKRGGDFKRQHFEDAVDTDSENLLPLLELDEAISRLERSDSKIAELVKLRFFAGLTGDKAAEALGISPRTADSWWSYARAFLASHLGAAESLQ